MIRKVFKILDILFLILLKSANFKRIKTIRLGAYMTPDELFTQVSFDGKGEW